MAAKQGDLTPLLSLIPTCNPKINGSEALRTAAAHGHLDVVRALIPISDPKINGSEALWMAAANGHLDVVRALIPVCDPKDTHSSALHLAAFGGHLDVVRMLIPVSDPKADRSGALQAAARNGHLEVVRALIPVSDPKAHDSQALEGAAVEGHLEVVRALLSVSDPKDYGRAQFCAARNGDLEMVRTLREFISVSDTAAAFRMALTHVISSDPFSIRAVDALAPYVSDEDQSKALSELSADVLERMPQLMTIRAERQAQALKEQLDQALPANNLPRRNRPSL